MSNEERQLEERQLSGVDLPDTQVQVVARQIWQRNVAAQPSKPPVTVEQNMRSIDLTNPFFSHGRKPAKYAPGFEPVKSAENINITGSTSQVEITTQSKLLLPADPNRKWLFMQNNDAIGVVTISFGVQAAINLGAVLRANGGGIVIDYNCPTAAIYGIGTIASNSNFVLIAG